MKVFVIGATGVLGRRAVAQLLAAGHEVTGVARSDEKAIALRAAGAAACELDAFDRVALIAAGEGFDAIVNLATHIPSGAAAARGASWKENDRIRREISANAAAAADANGSARLVQESIVLQYADAGDHWIDESGEIAPAPALECIPVAEANAFAAAENRPTTPVVLRFGLFNAPGSAHMQEQVKLARRGMAPVVGGPGGYIPTVDVDDAAAAVVLALVAPAGAYNVVDDEPMTRREFADTFAHAVGSKHASFAAARAAGLAGDKRTGGIMRSLRVTNAAFKEAVGWKPRQSTATSSLAAAIKRDLSERS